MCVCVYYALRRYNATYESTATGPRPNVVSTSYSLDITEIVVGFRRQSAVIGGIVPFFVLLFVQLLYYYLNRVVRHFIFF